MNPTLSPAWVSFESCLGCHHRYFCVLFSHVVESFGFFPSCYHYTLFNRIFSCLYLPLDCPGSNGRRLITFKSTCTSQGLLWCLDGTTCPQREFILFWYLYTISSRIHAKIVGSLLFWRSLYFKVFIAKEFIFQRVEFDLLSVTVSNYLASFLSGNSFFVNAFLLSAATKSSHRQRQICLKI